ncbi:DUF6518 family protein, partial [Nocardiopsis sp. NPDC060348]
MDTITERASPLVPLATAALGGLAVGVLTSFAQGWLPFALAPLANSSGSWSVAAFLAALLATRRWVGAATGVLALAAMVLGYDLASVLRGYSASAGMTVFWLTAAVTVGPVLGLGAEALRRRGAFAPWGVGVLCGVLIGEGVYGFLYILETTSPVYWGISTAGGVALLVWACLLRFPGVRPVLTAVAVTAVTATAFAAVYS